MVCTIYYTIRLLSLLTFQSGDAPVLAAAQQQIRHEFRQKSSLDSSDPTAKQSIQHAREVADFLRANVVQGQKLEGEDNMYRE